ncbi:MAG TPA: 4-alpha-glucanotransferase, partial [Dehalococcoidia bacterium]
LADWVRSLGASVVGTLPILAQFYDEAIFEPSPYSPASRLMWNEVYLDLIGLPEWSGRPRERGVLSSIGLQNAIADGRREHFIDWRSYAELRRSVLRVAAELNPQAERGPAFRDVPPRRPEVLEYARFRARTEHHGPWQSWRSAEPDFDPAVERYHAYAQWLCDEQLHHLALRGGSALYLDLPLGVHRAGFDTWRWPECFVMDASAGAPPDPLAAEGQDWAFPPLHPQGNREQGYEYVRAFLRHHMRYAGRLRIDHVMGLHRLYVIPRGFPASEGVYVRYPAPDLYALLSLESHRHKTEVVGENLGTVPVYVNRAMKRHGISGMYVLPFEIDLAAGRIREPNPESVAALNTHDLPTFESWWHGGDIDMREEAERLSPSGAAEERRRRKAERDTAARFLTQNGLLSAKDATSSSDVRRALMRYLADSPARLVLANLEDIWGETEPQNVPGTSSERPNWRHRGRLSLEDMEASEAVLTALREIDSARRGEL